MLLKTQQRLLRCLLTLILTNIAPDILNLGHDSAIDNLHILLNNLTEDLAVDSPAEEFLDGEVVQDFLSHHYDLLHELWAQLLELHSV
jgi:hypothetical protein